MNYIASIFCTFIICHSPQKSSFAQKVYKPALCSSARPFAPYSGLRQAVGSGPTCQSLSLWERWHRAAMTERASPSPGSRHAAMGRLFVRAMLSLRLLFFVSVLALSVTFGDSSPKGGASGGAGERSETERAQTPGTSSLLASSRRAVPSGRSLAASIWPGETW